MALSARSHNNNIAFYRRCSRITKTSVPENSLSRRLSSSRVDREKTAITRCHNKDAAPADNTMINTRRYLESAGRARRAPRAPARPRTRPTVASKPCKITPYVYTSRAENEQDAAHCLRYSREQAQELRISHNA